MRKSGYLAALTLALSLLAAASAPRKAEANACYAYTACAWGGVIECQTWGGPLATCAFNTVPGWSVQCVGYDNWGQWVNLFFHC